MKTLAFIIGILVIQTATAETAVKKLTKKANAVMASAVSEKTVAEKAADRAPASVAPAPQASSNITCYAANDRTYLCDGGLYVSCHGRIGNCEVMPPNLQFNQLIDTTFSTNVERGNWNALESFFEEKEYERSKRAPASN